MEGFNIDVNGKPFLISLESGVFGLIINCRYGEGKISIKGMDKNERFYTWYESLLEDGCSISIKLEEICRKLSNQIYELLVFHRSQKCKADCSCENKAEQASIEFIKSLPEIRQMLIDDIKSGHDGDPASKSFHEIILSYPYIEAVATYRVAHKLYELDVPVIPRVMTERAHSKTGIDIHPGAKIGAGFFIDHGTGVVIGETCKIGKNVTIYHGVTLGAFNPYDRENNKFQGKKRHPDVEDNVIIYAGAVILGGETVIGSGSVIGGNSLITKSVAPNSLVYSERQEIVSKPLD